jgi:ELMO domain-containing protein
LIQISDIVDDVGVKEKLYFSCSSYINKLCLEKFDLHILFAVLNKRDLQKSRLIDSLSAQASQNMEMLKKLVRSLWKWILHQISGKCEISRICESKSDIPYNADMAVMVLNSLAKSRQLSIYRSIIFSMKPFSAKSACDHVVNIKKLSKCPYNLNCCFEHVRQINSFIQLMETLVKTPYTPTNNSHTDLLERSYTALMGTEQPIPYIEGKSYNDNIDIESSKKWGHIGFQGNNPGTDFRGMGLLGLKQLEYYVTSQFHGDDAKSVLREANHPRRYFPFAATGINISKLCIEMLRETRLYARLLRVWCSDLPDSSNEHTSTNTKNEGNNTEHEPLLDSTTTAARLYGTQSTFKSNLSNISQNSYIESYNNFYCEVYTSFCELWVERDPRDIMAFPALFKEFTDNLRIKYPPIKQ